MSSSMPLSTTVYRIATPKAKLAALGDAERRLLLVLGHAANQISTLQRLTLFSLGNEWPDEVSDRIAVGRANVTLRLLAGAVWETHLLISKRVEGDKTGAKYLTMLMDGGKECYARLKRERGGEVGELLAELRNDHAFHYPENKAIDEAFNEIPDGESMEVIVSENGDATFFQMSEIMSIVALAKVIKGGDFGERIERLSKIITNHSGELVQFIQHYTGTIMQEASDILETEMVPVEIPATNMEDIIIPPVSKRRIKDR
jgi:hypothetical protein